MHLNLFGVTSVLGVSMSSYIFLSVYDGTQMLKKLSKQLSGEDWAWNNLNTLCWAIGSISGSMAEEQVCVALVLLE